MSFSDSICPASSSLGLGTGGWGLGAEGWDLGSGGGMFWELEGPSL